MQYLIGIIVLAVVFVLARMEGQKAGEKGARERMAKEISESRDRDVNDEYQAEGDLPPDELVDRMLEWLRSRNAKAGESD